MRGLTVVHGFLPISLSGTRSVALSTGMSGGRGERAATVAGGEDVAGARHMAIDWMTLATIVGFPAIVSARRSAMVATIADKYVEPPVLRLPEPQKPIIPATTIIADVPANVVSRLPRVPAIDADEAVRRFVSVFAEYQGGETLPFAFIHEQYGLMRQQGDRRAADWPAISSKAFAQKLKAIGCERVQEDRRAANGTRPVCYVIPETMECAMTDAA